MLSGMESRSDANDGRTNRRNRNAEAVLDAVMELFLEQNLDPHPSEIAERAGVSLRSVYRYLGDSDLMRAGMDRIVERHRRHFTIDDLGSGTLDHRIDTLVQSRVRGVRRNAALIAAADKMAATRSEIPTRVTERRRLLREQTAAQFAVELEPSRPDAPAVLDAVDGLTQIETVMYFIEGLGHSDARAIRRLSTALGVLLAT